MEMDLLLGSQSPCSEVFQKGPGPWLGISHAWLGSSAGAVRSLSSARRRRAASNTVRRCREAGLYHAGPSSYLALQPADCRWRRLAGSEQRRSKKNSAWFGNGPTIVARVMCRESQRVGQSRRGNGWLVLRPLLCGFCFAVSCGLKFWYPFKNDVFKTSDHGRVTVSCVLEPLQFLAQCSNLIAAIGLAMRASRQIAFAAQMLPQEVMVVWGDIRRSRCKLRSIEATRTRKRHRDSRAAGGRVL